MKTRDTLRKLAAFLEGDERARAIQLILQLLCVVSATVYAFRPAWGFWCAVGFSITMVLQLCMSIVVLLFFRRYDLNMLYCHKATGKLYDKRLRLTNVALRINTIQTLLNMCTDKTDKASTAGCDLAEVSKRLYNSGYNVGSEFVKVFTNLISISKENAPKERETLEMVLRYDSSSGMGKFEVTEYEKENVRIVISNPFTESDVDGDVSDFLKGYVAGVVSEITGKKFTISASRKSKAEAILLASLSLSAT